MKSLAASQTQHAQAVKVIGISTESERTVRDDGTMSRDYTMAVDSSGEL